MSVSDEYLIFVKDQMSYLELIAIRRMFSGAWINYKNKNRGQLPD